MEDDLPKQAASSTGAGEGVQIKIQLKAVGAAPILKQSKFKVRDTLTVGEILLLIRKTLKIRDGEPIFIYLNSSFSPSPDQTIAQLFESFHVGGELVLQYNITNSWG